MYQCRFCIGAGADRFYYVIYFFVFEKTESCFFKGVIYNEHCYFCVYGWCFCFCKIRTSELQEEMQKDYEQTLRKWED